MQYIQTKNFHFLLKNVLFEIMRSYFFQLQYSAFQFQVFFPTFKLYVFVQHSERLSVTLPLGNVGDVRCTTNTLFTPLSLDGQSEKLTHMQSYIYQAV